MYLIYILLGLLILSNLNAVAHPGAIPQEEVAMAAFSPGIATSITFASISVEAHPEAIGVEAVGGSHFKIKENYNDEDLPVFIKVSRSFGSKPHIINLPRKKCIW